MDKKERLYPSTIRILQTLIAHPKLSIEAIAKRVHLDKSSVQKRIDFLHDNGLAHISARERVPRSQRALWSAGAGADVPRLAPLTCAQKTAAWRDRGGDGHRAARIRKELALAQQPSMLATVARSLTSRKARGCTD